jgi:ketosteroid isomerase-like protein
MHELANRDLMLKVMTAFGKGDLEPLFAALDDSVVWTSHAPRPYFRFGGVHKGRTGIREYTALVFSRYSFSRFEAKSILAKDEIVCGVFEAEAWHQPSGKVVRSDVAIRWRVRDGRILEHQGFFDTAGVLMQQGDLAA